MSNKTGGQFWLEACLDTFYRNNISMNLTFKAMHDSGYLRGNVGFVAVVDNFMVNLTSLINLEEELKGTTLRDEAIKIIKKYMPAYSSLQEGLDNEFGYGFTKELAFQAMKDMGLGERNVGFGAVIDQFIINITTGYSGEGGVIEKAKDKEMLMKILCKDDIREEAKKILENYKPEYINKIQEH